MSSQSTISKIIIDDLHEWCWKYLCYGVIISKPINQPTAVCEYSYTITLSSKYTLTPIIEVYSSYDTINIGLYDKTNSSPPRLSLVIDLNDPDGFAAIYKKLLDLVIEHYEDLYFDCELKRGMPLQVIRKLERVRSRL